jgi:hypothetical protein
MAGARSRSTTPKAVLVPGSKKADARRAHTVWFQRPNVASEAQKAEPPSAGSTAAWLLESRPFDVQPTEGV